MINYLKMWTRHTSRYLSEQRLHHFLELGWFNNIQYLFYFSQEHHLMRNVCTITLTENLHCMSLQQVRNKEFNDFKCVTVLLHFV